MSLFATALAVSLPAQVFVDPKDIDVAFDAAMKRGVAMHTSSSHDGSSAANPLAAAFLDRVPLNDDERAMFAKNGGVVVVPALGGGGPAQVYDRIYTHDIPLFLTADSILYAWHETVDDL